MLCLTGNGFAHADKHRIARSVPVVVVVVLEVVDINHRHGDANFFARGLTQNARQKEIQLAAVGQAGERVVSALFVKIDVDEKLLARLHFPYVADGKAEKRRAQDVGQMQVADVCIRLVAHFQRRQ